MRLRKDSGRIAEVALPPNLEQIAPDLAAEVAKADALAGELDAARAELDTATAALDVWVGEDRSAYAKALIAGAAPPKDTSAKLRDRIEAAKRRVEGVELAVVEQAAIVKALVESRRGELIGVCETLLEASSERYTAQVDALIAARSELSEAEGTLAWVRSFPNGKVVDWRPGAGWFWFPEQTSWPAVEAGLRRNADPKLRHVDPRAPQTVAQEVERIRTERAAA